VTGTITLLGPWPPPTGGVATHMTRLRACLVARDMTVQVLGHGRFAPTPGLHRLDLHRRAPSVYRRLTRHVAPGGLLHGHSTLTADPTVWRLAAFLAVVTRRRSVWIETLHDQTLIKRFPSMPKPVRIALGASLRRAAHVIAVNDDLADFAADRGVNRGSISVIGPLLPQESGPGDVPAGLADFIGARTPLLLAVGASTPDYDFLTAVHGFRVLLETMPNAGLVLAGSGFARDGRYSATIDETVRPVASSVRRVEDLPAAELGALMREASVVVRGFAHDSFGLTRVEASVAGTPVVATPVGEQRFIEPYAHGDADSFVAAVRRALATPREQLAAAREHYSREAEANLASILEIYDKCSSAR
jgi:glycosyltransferase involved in cell wall biosynthesis